jgi:hypothetical protein
VGDIRILPETWQKMFLETLRDCNDQKLGLSPFCDESSVITDFMTKNYGFAISYDGSEDTTALVRELFDQRLIEQPRGDVSLLQVTQRGRKQIQQFEAVNFRENLISKLSAKKLLL